MHASCYFFTCQILQAKNDTCVCVWGGRGGEWGGGLTLLAGEERIFATRTHTDR